MPSESVGVAPEILLGVVTAVGGWIGAMWTYRDKLRERNREKDDNLEIHRDGLTLQLIRAGREELALARVEADDLREEVRKLRGMEAHFFHFQQSLDHLEALLTAETDHDRGIAERNATAFLKRMKRLQDAKGTVANEAQRIVSEIRVLDQTQPDNYGEKEQ